MIYPSFSVLMSIYWRENPRYLSQAFDSLFNQTVVPTEIVLVKDGPLTEEIESVITQYQARYPSILKIVPLPTNVGLGNALREGLNACSHEFVARMDTDDICVPDRFERQLRSLTLNPEIAVVGGFIGEFYDEQVDYIKYVRKVPTSPQDILKYAKYRNPVNHVTAMFRKSIVLKVGGYQHFLGVEDYYLWARLLNNGYQILNLDEILVKVRTGKEMYSRRGGFDYIKSEYRLQKAFLDMGFINTLQFAFNVTSRTLVRIFPNNLRGLFYEKFLRESINN